MSDQHNSDNTPVKPPSIRLESAVTRLETAVNAVKSRTKDDVHELLEQHTRIEKERDAARAEVDHLKKQLSAMQAEHDKMQELVNSVAQRVDSTIEQLELIMES